MAVLGKKLGKATGKKAINNRYKWVEFIDVIEDEEGNEEHYLIRCYVRTSLTNGEIEKLVGFNGSDEEVFKFAAPYVADWDITWEEDGDLFAVGAPGVVGWEAFNYAPKGLAYAIINALTHEAFEKVDPKSSKPAESSE